MPWAPLMMMPDRGQLYDAMAQAYVPQQPQVDPAAYSAALAGVDAGALAYQPASYADPAQVPYDPAFVPVDPYAGVPSGPYVSPTYDSAQRLLDENEALLRAIYSNANL